MSKNIKLSRNPSFVYLAGIFAFVCILVVSLLIAPYVLGATADGSGPWADEVVTSAQGTLKDGSAVLPIRSDSSQAVGVAEATDAEGTFFSLGFPNGSITLKFTNPIYNGVGADLSIVETTHMPYGDETASVEVSEDGVTYESAGSVTFDGNVDLPEGMSCAQYVRIVNTTNPDLMEDSADGFDVDGVQALHSQGSCGEDTEPSPNPTVSPTPTATPSNDSGSNDDNNEAPKCTAGKPGTPSITNVNQLTSTSVQVTWTAVSPVTHYTLSYGTSAGNYQYGVSNTGNVTTYTIGGLQSGVAYYFAVYAVNDCAPSDKSNEVGTGGQVLGASTGGQVLGASTTSLASTGSFNEAFSTALAIIGVVVSFGYFSFKRKSL